MARSFPTRERGLKYISTKIGLYGAGVVPHEGTWIEIWKITKMFRKYMSFPTRERGLKYQNQKDCLDLLLSFPTRERGLKSTLGSCIAIVMICRSPRGNVD